MAVFSLNVKCHSRSRGLSAVAGAAYRSGQILIDRRTGQVFDYRRRKGVEHREILLPTDAKPLNREELWNAVERAEKRKNSTVAREFLIALPHELSRTQNERLARDYARWLVDRFGFPPTSAYTSRIGGPLSRAKSQTLAMCTPTSTARRVF